MNRLRGVDEEMEPEELEWVEKSRRVRDDGTGRDWWGNPVGMGDWGRTILSELLGFLNLGRHELKRRENVHRPGMERN